MSISGAMISTISAFRNPTFNMQPPAVESQGMIQGMEEQSSVTWNRRNSLKVMVAEVGYILTIPFAVVEAALSLTAKIFSFPLPISKGKHRKISTWLTDSMLAVRYSIANAILNPFRFQLVEKHAYAQQNEEYKAEVLRSQSDFSLSDSDDDDTVHVVQQGLYTDSP